jgi:hypothetical protein
MMCVVHVAVQGEYVYIEECKRNRGTGGVYQGLEILTRSAPLMLFIMPPHPRVSEVPLNKTICNDTLRCRAGVHTRILKNARGTERLRAFIPGGRMEKWKSFARYKELGRWDRGIVRRSSFAAAVSINEEKTRTR